MVVVDVVVVALYRASFLCKKKPRIKFRRFGSMCAAIKSFSAHAYLPKPIFCRRFTVDFRHKMTNERFLIECRKVRAQKIMPNAIHTMMVQLQSRETRIEPKCGNVWNMQLSDTNQRSQIIAA